MSHRWRQRFPILASLALACLAGDAGPSTGAAPVQTGPLSSPAPLTAPGADLFARRAIPRLAITLKAGDVDRLRQNGRQEVPATIVEDAETTYPGVRLHLKGSTGSYRGIDDKPSFTLVFGEHAGGQRFHGLRKLHLNNSVEDPSYFNEYAGSGLFCAAGVPAPRITHAVLTLNGRRLGLYVLKEGFAEEFLGLHFRDPQGNLYDTGTGHDVDEELERDAGTGPEDRRDLASVATAAREPDIAARWERLGRVLDLDRFTTFMAMEVLIGHRDGYCMARNNFPIYHDPTADRIVFLPHGMDQLFGRPDATLHPTMQGLVARAVLETPEGRRQYREKIACLATDVLDVKRLERQADALLRRLRSGLGPAEFRAVKRELAANLERIALRQRFVEQQLKEPEPHAVAFVDGRLLLTEWQAVDPPEGGRMNQRLAPEGREALYIRAGPVTSASWRSTVRLGAGRYRFRATVTTRGVVALSFGNNHGVGLRVVGGSPSGAYMLVGNHSESPLERGFTIDTERDVELICELRARAGEAWFLLNSLSLEFDDGRAL